MKNKLSKPFRLSRLPSFLDLSERRDFFNDLHTSIDRVFEQATSQLGELAPFEGSSFLRPRIDVTEDDNSISVKAELPGIDKKDIDIKVSEGILRIKGEKNVKRDEKKEAYHIIERASGSFLRDIPVPFEVEPGKVDASFKDGILSIKIPKPEKEKRKLKDASVKIK